MSRKMFRVYCKKIAEKYQYKDFEFKHEIGQK